MTKRDIIKFLERKQQEKANAVNSEYSANRQLLVQGIYADLGLPELASKIQPLLEEVYRLWENWKSTLENHDGVDIKNYYTLEYWLNNYVGAEDSAFQKISEGLKLETAALKNLWQDHNDKAISVNRTYNTVITTAREMKTAKQAASYLKELGFDLSELENPVEQMQTALMVPIDTRFLFVKAA